MMKCFSHGGNIKEMAERFGLKECNIIDFSSNVNPLGLPSSVRKVIRDNIKNIFRYPDPKSSDLKRVLGKYLKVSDENIIVGNGSTELIYQIAYTFKPKVALMVLPTFSEYEKALTTVGTKIEYLRLEEKDEFRISIKEIVKKIHGVNMVFLCNPNNPTGQIVKREDMVLLLKKIETGKVIVVVDEAFIDLAEENSLIDLILTNNLLVLRSMTKFFGLAGLRLGYVAGRRKFIENLENFRQPWTVNVFAQMAGVALIQNEKFKKISKDMFLNERKFLYEQLCCIKGLRPYPSCANFILLKIDPTFSSTQLQEYLLKRGILIRDCSNFRGLDDRFIRVAVRGRKENLRLIEELSAVFMDR